MFLSLSVYPGNTSSLDKSHTGVVDDINLLSEERLLHFFSLSREFYTLIKHEAKQEPSYESG